MWPSGRSTAFVCQRSRVLSWTCRQKCLWGLCRSRYDGGTGLRSDKFMTSTTTWIPNWKVLCVSEEKLNYGNYGLLIQQISGMCAHPPRQNSPFVQLGLHHESSQRRGHMTFTWLLGVESAFCLGAWIHSRPPPPLFCSTFLSEQLSQDVAEMLLVVRREVEEDGSWLNSDDAKKWCHRTNFHMETFWKMTVFFFCCCCFLFLFFYKKPHYRNNFRECTRL